MIMETIIGGCIVAGLGSTFWDSIEKHSVEGKVALIFKRAGFGVDSHENRRDGRNKKIHYPELIKKTYEGENTVLYYRLPAGLSYFLVQKNLHFLKSGLKSDVKLKFLENDPISDMKMIIYSGYLPDESTYNIEHIKKHLKKTGLHAPLGFSRKGLEQIDLTNAVTPHFVSGGETGEGKTSLIRMAVTSLLLTHSPEEIRLWLMDLKNGTEFEVFRNTIFCDKSIGRPEDAKEFLQALLDEQYRRLDVFKGLSCVRIDRYNEKAKNKMPRILLLIDELSLLEGKRFEEEREQLLTQITAFGRATGVHLIIGTHRTDAKVMSGRMKENISTIIAFPCNPTSARVLLGEDNAEYMKILDTEVRGRALLFNRRVTEIQIPFLDEDVAFQLLKPFEKNEKCEIVQNCTIQKSV